MTTTGSAAFTTTHRVIDGIHRNTTHTWAASEPAAATCLAEALALMLVIADFTDGGAAAGIKIANFAGRHLHRGTVAINGNQLCRLTGGTGDLRAAARFVRPSATGWREAHPHDVTITREAPNYHL